MTQKKPASGGALVGLAADTGFEATFRLPAVLDEQLRFSGKNPSIGLALCKTADKVQICLALTAAANKIGVATYQTALPDERPTQTTPQSVGN